MFIVILEHTLYTYKKVCSNIKCFYADSSLMHLVFATSFS